MSDCVFCKIRDGEIAKEFAYQDEDVMVFEDINPVKPSHHLVVPKKHISDFLELSNDNLKVKILDTVQRTARKLDGEGFRIVINGGGAQVVDHLHFHVFGPMGMKAGWNV